MRYAYITTLSTNNYLEGVLALNEQLISLNSEYPLVCLINQSINQSTIHRLKEKNIIVKLINTNINLDNEVKSMNKSKGHEHYNNTFDKLYIFGCVEYEKLVYIDSDMLLLKNIDNLFNNKHMSATIAGKSYPGNEGWKDLNSGLMVIEPNQGMVEELIKLIPIVIKKKEVVGDQDIIQEYYPNWNELNLELSEGYNIFCNHIDYYINKKAIKEEDVKIIHFIGKTKPWMRSYSESFLEKIKLILKGKIKSCKYLIYYEKILKKIKEKN